MEWFFYKDHYGLLKHAHGHTHTDTHTNAFRYMYICLEEVYFISIKWNHLGLFIFLKLCGTFADCPDLLQIYYRFTHVPWYWFCPSVALSSTWCISPNAMPLQCSHSLLFLSNTTQWPQWEMFQFLHPWVLIIQHRLLSENRLCLVMWSCASLLTIMVLSMSVQTTWTHLFFFNDCKIFHGVYCYIFFNLSIIDGHLNWQQVFAIVNTTAINICENVCL